MSKVSEWAACADLPTAEMRARCEAECFEEAHARAVGRTPVTPHMTERQMLHILQSRLYSDAPRWYWAIRDAGGPSKGRLDGYISAVLAGYAMRVDHRIRPILIALDNGAKRGVNLGPFPPGPFRYHPGKTPPSRRRRQARKAEADAAASAAAYETRVAAAHKARAAAAQALMARYGHNGVASATAEPPAE